MLSSNPLRLLLQPAAAGDAAPAAWGEVLGATSPLGWAPLLLLGGPAAIAVILGWLYVRTARQHRLAAMAPPVWLLPYLERSTGDAEQLPALTPDADHALQEEMRLESAARLARRKRMLLVGLGLNFLAGWAGAGVLLYASNRSVEFQEFPSRAGILATIDTSAYRGLEGADSDTAGRRAAAEVAGDPRAQEDTAALRLRRQRAALLARRRDSVAEAQRLDSIAIAESVAQRVRDSVTRALRDSLAQAAARATPPPPPPPPPPPAPPPPDPAVEMARAVTAIRQRMAQVVAAINQAEGLASLVAAGPGRDRLTAFVTEAKPVATLGTLPDPSVAAGRAETVATVQLQWRGPFGDTRRRAVTFRVEAAARDGAWQVVRVVPPDDLP